ncbi:hypothetical protein [Rufibacter latericius]|uniref:YARHG domain-containing protein n=1 Tax=Rufibacter latericius TaxID=2487040 RepID=A0A3M9MM78_9BACT|nr:hypothetical protein [Rufibacter latericius]RNI25788.1 hypothetical protein EFB08_13125 [Rufibacter latericius]
MAKKLSFFTALLAVVLLIAQSCAKHYFRSTYQDANALLHHTKNLQTKPFLKAHLRNGDICILKDTWGIDTTLNTLQGHGTKYDFNRNVLQEGALSLPMDSVSIFETNTKLQTSEKERIAALAILTGVDIAVGILCLANPKACFGSCPTFYLKEEDSFHYADAEGFSNAISPSLEYFDIDALNNPAVSGDTFSLYMRNEALETHCLQEVKLLAYPRKEGERVYQSPTNDFYLCYNKYALSLGTGPEGNITSLLQQEDRQERFSLADEANLSTKETLSLTFDGVQNPENLGLILHFRQTLMTTYFIYSAMGYMGDEVGDIFAKLETGSDTKEKLKGGIKKELGDVEVYLWEEQKKVWVLQSGLNETGPIAINRQFVPLQNRSRSPTIKMKIVLNKGLWRLDYAALTNIKEQVQPVVLSPTGILKDGKPDAAALRTLNHSTQHLISMPGNDFQFNFTLPSPATDYELFLFSKGYYLEWMRENWLQEKDLLKLKQMIDKPRKYLQGEAKNYKRYESTMEKQFWESKIDTKTFSAFEHQAPLP